jgi:MFS family permease
VIAVLAAFMGGLALGGALFGRWADRTERRLTLYGWLEIAVGVYGLAFPTLLAGATGFYVWLARAFAIGPLTTFSLRFAIALLLVVIPTTLMGGTLPLLVRHLAGQRGGTGRGVAWLYFLNSAGAAIGCLLAGFFTIVLRAQGDLDPGGSDQHRRGSDRTDAAPPERIAGLVRKPIAAAAAAAWPSPGSWHEPRAPLRGRGDGV